MNELEDLLTRLEEVSARADEVCDPELVETANIDQVVELIKARGELIGQLQRLLASHSPVSFMEWNRLVVIHRQGTRLQENSQRVRSQVVRALAANSSGRVFLERVTGMLTPAPNRS